MIIQKYPDACLLILALVFAGGHGIVSDCSEILLNITFYLEVGNAKKGEIWIKDF